MLASLSSLLLSRKSLLLASIAATFLNGRSDVNAADVIQVNDARGLREAIAKAGPGDTIRIAAGEYRGGFYLKDLHGEINHPITIVADDEQNPPRFTHEADPLHLSGCSHVVIKNITIDGAGSNGLNIDDGGRREQPSHHIQIIGVKIMGISPEGNRDGIKMSGVDDFRIEDCKTHRWGRGGSGIDMVGCHRGLIQNCEFRDGGSSGVQTKGASADVTIRKCRFENFGERAVNIGGSTGDDYFRPPLDSMPNGERYEARNIVVEGCVFVGGMTPIVFVGVDGAAVRYNTIYNPTRYPIRILREKSEPGFLPTRNGRFEYNIVVAPEAHWPGNLINIGPGTSPETFVFARNLWFCEQTSDHRMPKFPVNDTESIVGKDPLFVDAKNDNFDVLPDSPAKNRGAHAFKPDAP